MKQLNEELEQLLVPLRQDEIAVAEGHSTPTEQQHHGTFTTVRETTHRDKQIEIHTTYRILIDGEPLMTHTGVLNNGGVHTQSLPQYAFDSAMDMVKKIIDVFDLEFPDDELGKGASVYPEQEEV